MTALEHDSDRGDDLSLRVRTILAERRP